MSLLAVADVRPRRGSPHAIDALVADIPLLSVGLLSFGVFTFLLCKKRLNLLVLCLHLSALLAFFAAIIDLARILAQTHARRGAGLSSGAVASLVDLRELGLALSFGFRYLFWWAFVAARPVGISSRSLQTAHPDLHCAAWQHWGLVGTCLKWGLLALALLIPTLQIVWRIAPSMHEFGPLYAAEATLQIIVSAVFALKLLLNVYICVASRAKVLCMYAPALAALALSVSVGVGNLITFPFSENTYGRFLLAVELYMAIVYSLVLAFQGASASQLSPEHDDIVHLQLPEKPRPAKAAQTSPAMRTATTPVFPPSDDATAGHTRVPSRVSAWLLPQRFSRRPQSIEKSLWTYDNAEPDVSVRSSRASSALEALSPRVAELSPRSAGLRNTISKPAVFPVPTFPESPRTPLSPVSRAAPVVSTSPIIPAAPAIPAGPPAPATPVAIATPIAITAPIAINPFAMPARSVPAALDLPPRAALPATVASPDNATQSAAVTSPAEPAPAAGIKSPTRRISPGMPDVPVTPTPYSSGTTPPSSGRNASSPTSPPASPPASAVSAPSATHNSPFSVNSYYGDIRRDSMMSTQSRDSYLHSPQYLRGSQYLDPASPVYGFGAFAQRDAERRSRASMSSITELLRQQTELDRSIAALRLFSPAPEATAFTGLGARTSGALTVAESVSERSEFSLGMFPDPPEEAATTPVTRAARRGAGSADRGDPILGPVPAIVLSDNMLSYATPFDVDRAPKTYSTISELDVSSFIDNLATPTEPPDSSKRSAGLSDIDEEPAVPPIPPPSPPLPPASRPVIFGPARPFSPLSRPITPAASRPATPAPNMPLPEPPASRIASPLAPLASAISRAPSPLLPTAAAVSMRAPSPPSPPAFSGVPVAPIPRTPPSRPTLIITTALDPAPVTPAPAAAPVTAPVPASAVSSAVRTAMDASPASTPSPAPTRLSAESVFPALGTRRPGRAGLPSRPRLGPARASQGEDAPLDGARV